MGIQQVAILLFGENERSNTVRINRTMQLHRGRFAVDVFALAFIQVCNRIPPSAQKCHQGEIDCVSAHVHDRRTNLSSGSGRRNLRNASGPSNGVTPGNKVSKLVVRIARKGMPHSRRIRFFIARGNPAGPTVSCSLTNSFKAPGNFAKLSSTTCAATSKSMKSKEKQ